MRRFMRNCPRFLVAALGCFLAGCASTGGVGLETALEPSRLNLLVATTRAPAPESGAPFSGERGDKSLAAVVVSIPPDARREIGQIQWPQRTPPDPATEFATLSVKTLQGSPQEESWLRAHKSPSRRILLFVHGFNTGFDAALFRFAQIVHDSGADATPVLFTWPSRGSVFEYSYDRESANFSRDALEKLLRRLSESPNVSEITILAHSMGAWLASESLRQMAIREGRVREKIRSVIFAAPDLDVDVFQSQLRSLGDRRPRFVIFVSRGDRALWLSRRIAGNVERLGRVDPDAKPWLAEAGVDVIDLTGTQSGGFLRHGKFAENPDVVRYLGMQLINEEGSDAQAGLGERTMRRVSSAAGLMVGAPIAIVDPNMRRAYSEQIDQFRRAFGEP